VIHLAGESIAGGRWTEAQKQRILDSRTRGTTLLAETLARLSRKPAVLVSASAVGIYGNRGDELLTESAGLRTGPATFFVERVGAGDRVLDLGCNTGLVAMDIAERS